MSSRVTAPAETPAEDPLDPPTRGERMSAEMRERVESLGERFEEPIQTVTTITQKTMALFPVRVWRWFLFRNGFLLSAGMSYQAIFAVFAAVYVVFAATGIWLGGDPATLDALINLINTYVPGLIAEGGAITPDQLTAIADSSTSLFGWTGAVALAGFIWTAIGWITYSRTAVRSLFGLPKDMRSYVLLKARDLLAALAFGAMLLVGSLLSVASTAAATWVFTLLGLDMANWLVQASIGGAGFLVVLVINTAVLLAMFRFLSGASVKWSRLWSGSVLGGVAMYVLQIGAGYLVGSATSNPLFATFTVFIGLLLWFRLTAIVTLVAASWIYVAASDRSESLRRVTPAQLEAERRQAEREALILATQVELREAREEAARVGWVRRATLRRRIARLQAELDDLQAASTTEDSVGRPPTTPAASPTLR
ncbi:YhjD/YihY/BrkB family envelope integrity protein [Leifsonia sp. YIM 134122]|uniref:YhjD/YihY/BrkB family envelope integrity protein n=1 Tax=Leifsonia stereocauli TaxID=3134136 RepID=A0ABU9W3P4_9MICO